MLKNYLKTALRNLSRNKVYSILNVLGLALGIGCALVIFKVISFEQSFDKHLSQYNSIYRVVHEDSYPDGNQKGMGTPHPVGPALREEFPELKTVVRTHYIGGEQLNVNKGDMMDKFLIEEGMAFVENGFFELFDATFIAGDSQNALKSPNTVVISKSVARLLFGYPEGMEQEAMERTINYFNQKDFKVTGVINDPPEATNFPFKILLEYTSQKDLNPYYNDDHWGSTSSNTNTWMLVNEGFDPSVFKEKLNELHRKYDEEEAESRVYFTQALSDVHQNDELGNYSYTITPQLINALTIIAIFLVLTACINFINLATAQAANRSKEIGIRKALGGYSRQLVAQFFIEVSVITLASLLVSLAISELLFSQLEEILGTRLQLELGTLGTIGFLVIIFVGVSFLSGFYPSVLLSHMNTVKALKNKITARDNSGKLNLRKGLVVTQFAITQFLIIGTIIIAAQMDYFLTKELGFETAAIVKSYLPEQDKVKNERFRNLLTENPEIEQVTFSLSSPTGNSNANSSFNYAALESENDYEATFKCSDEYYMDLYGLELISGRNLVENDSNRFVVINQRAADLLGFKDRYDEVVGERLQSGWGGDLKVVGVMKDFHTRELSQDLEFVFLINEPTAFYEVAIKTAAGADVRKAVTKFESAWEEVYPNYVIDWQFFNEELAENYEQEQSLSQLMSLFSIVSIVIGCLGLYGLIAFIAANRTKEVGIRKVLGASIFSIINKFTTEVLVLVIIAFMIAAPSAYYFLNGWLDNYQFRVSMGFEFFALAFIVTLVIAFITISYRTISTARINPATTLKDE